MSTPSPYCCGALAALLALASAPSHARDDTAPGMVVVRDAATGQLRPPTPAELRALRAADPSAAPPQPRAPSIVRPDGSRKLRLSDNNMVYSVVTRDAAGHTAVDCVQGGAAAEAARLHPAQATGHKESGHERD